MFQSFQFQYSSSFLGVFHCFCFFFKSGILRGSSVCSEYIDQQGSLSHVCFCFSFCLESLQSGILFHLICLYIKSSGGKSRGYHLCSACIYHINHNWGTHVLNPNCLSVMWMLSVSWCIKVYLDASDVVWGLLNMLFQLTIPAGSCYLLNCITVSAWGKPSENCCLHCLIKCIPKEKGRERQDKQQLQPWPFSTSQQDTGKSSSRALQKEVADAATAWECVVGGILAKAEGVPLGLVFQPSSSTRSNTSCTTVSSMAQPKPCGNSAAEIRIESKFSGWGQWESFI